MAPVFLISAIPFELHGRDEMQSVPYRLTCTSIAAARASKNKYCSHVLVLTVVLIKQLVKILIARSVPPPRVAPHL